MSILLWGELPHEGFFRRNKLCQDPHHRFRGVKSGCPISHWIVSELDTLYSLGGFGVGDHLSDWKGVPITKNWYVHQALFYSRIL